LIKRPFTIFLLIALASLIALPDFASAKSSHSLRLGPPTVGQGGSNALGVPPGSEDIEYGYVSEGNFEFNLGLFPGIMFGGRAELKQLYSSLGGGLVIGGNGIGPGFYYSMGFLSEFIPGMFFNIEYKQAFGYYKLSNRWVAPGALRIGITSTR